MQKGIRRGPAQSMLRQTQAQAVRKKRIKRKKKKSGLRRLLNFFLLLFFIVIGYAAHVTYQAYDASKSSYYSLERGDKSELRDNAVTIADDPVSILILGVEGYAAKGNN